MQTARFGSRRRFLQGCGMLGGLVAAERSALGWFRAPAPAGTPKVSAHLWVYASAHPPDWDATPDLERAFSDLQFAGFDGVELLAVMLKHDDAVERIGALSSEYRLPITGASFGGDMWDFTKRDTILQDAAVAIQRLALLKGKTFGLSVGDAKRTKTDGELDVQADVLRGIHTLCKTQGIVPNLHNHTYEVENGMHDLKGTLARLPDVKLGPDFNWMIRGGVNPIEFIQTYGDRIVYMHLRDQYADGTWTEYPGQGVTDFAGIAAALKATHFHGSAAVELAFPPKFVPQHPLRETWKLSRQFVKTTFGW